MRLFGCGLIITVLSGVGATDWRGTHAGGTCHLEDVTSRGTVT